MKLPTLKGLATSHANVEISNGTDENGSVTVEKEIPCDCRVEQRNDVVALKDGRQVTVLMKVFIFDKLDEFPDNILGFCTLFNYRYDIAKGSIKRNPDGSVNHIVLELM